METIRLFIGYDEREAIGTWVFLQSLRETTSYPVSVTMVGSKSVERDGTNAFIYSRFMVPYLCDFKGHAIFMDGADMLLRADLKELWDMRNDKAVQVVMHDYRTKHDRKYIGTDLEADNEHYLCKNWSSVVIWNNSHEFNRRMTPDFVAKQPGHILHRFSWIGPDDIGALPVEWNHLVGEYDENREAKLAHYTLGVPGFAHYAQSEFADEWRETLRRSQRGAW